MKRILIAIVSTLLLAPFIFSISAKAESLESLIGQEDNMARQAMHQASYISFVAWENNPETIKQITTLASLMHQGSEHYALAAQYGFKVKQPPIYPDLWMALMQIEAKKSFIVEQLSKVYLQMIPALQASDTSHVNQLALQINNLRQDVQKLNNEIEQIIQIRRIRNDEANININQNSINMFKKLQENQRCIYDNRPHGSESEVASDPSKYCNGY
ncbi:MAG: hypothetical protein H0X31_00005 [Nostocaceae cyanobacterium]|nr:hypothetical protein [Nostocaceae cyanobacterium]